jgi:hypothetical protein
VAMEQCRGAAGQLALSIGLHMVNPMLSG